MGKAVWCGTPNDNIGHTSDPYRPDSCPFRVFTDKAQRTSEDRL